MAINFRTNLAADLQQYFGDINSTRKRVDTPPITYTSIRGWMVMNYIGLVTLLALPVTFILWLLHIL